MQAADRHDLLPGRKLSMTGVKRDWLAMFYFLLLNSGPVISGNDISVYPVTGIGFVLRDFSKVFPQTFRLDMAELTLRAVIK